MQLKLLHFSGHKLFKLYYRAAANWAAHSLTRGLCTGCGRRGTRCSSPPWPATPPGCRGGSPEATTWGTCSTGWTGGGCIWTEPSSLVSLVSHSRVAESAPRMSHWTRTAKLRYRTRIWNLGAIPCKDSREYNRRIISECQWANLQTNGIVTLTLIFLELWLYVDKFSGWLTWEHV